MPAPPPRDPAPALTPLEEMSERLARAVADSPADETEIAWIEVRRNREETARRRRDDPEAAERRERTILVRVVERGRTGTFRTGSADPGDLEAAVREALAQARLNPPVRAAETAPGPAGPAASPEREPTAQGEMPAASAEAGSSEVSAAAPAPLEPRRPPVLFDEELAGLDAGAARSLLGRLGGRGEALRLGWLEGRVAVAGTIGDGGNGSNGGIGGLRRAARATAVTLEAARGRGPGAGRAAAAARTLAGLDAAAVVERARSRQGPEQPVDPPSEGALLLLSPEAAAALLDLFNRLALSSLSFREATSPLAGRLGERLLAPALHLRDDGTSGGLPFPFDLLGMDKRPVDLVARGVFLTPAVDRRLAAEIGLPVTPHAVSPDESLAGHLHLLPGSLSEEELARDLGAGVLWVGALDRLECYDPASLRFRAVAQGVRRIEGGRLGPSLPDLDWDDRLIEALARAIAVGASSITVAGPEPLLGGTRAPALALARGGSLGTLTPRS